MYATLTIEGIDYTQDVELTPEQQYLELSLWAQQCILSVEENVSTVVAEFFLGNYIKGDPGQGTTIQIDFTLSDWVSVAGGYELILQHNLENTVISEIHSGGKVVEADKINFNENTIKISVPYDFRFEGYAIIKN